MDPAVNPSVKHKAIIISTRGTNLYQEAKKKNNPCRDAIKAKIHVRLILM